MTGAGDGIGLATARALAAEGAALAAVPLGRVGQPGGIVFLAPNDAGFITGAAVDANGGIFMA